MYLSQIDIHGFKSFATKTALTFSPEDKMKKGITAVVGPNGSGKSNIADAIRWVLGEQSVKLLRGKKSEDVIFAGSEKKSRLGMAEVVLTINNEDGDFPMEASEVTIGRRLYRDGSSEYYVQGNKVRLLDVSMLLARAGIGGRSYAVIGQGMIDHVLVSSPTERKAFFDEAAGVKEFEMKKRQAENKLKASRENLEHAQTVIEELTPRMRSLSRAVKRLEERGEVEAELKKVQKLYYGAQWRNVADRLGAVAGKEKEINRRLEAANKKRGDLQNQLSGLEQSNTVSEDILKFQKQYEGVRREREDVYKKLMKTQTEVEILKARSRVVTDSRQIPQGEVAAALDDLSQVFDKLLGEVENCGTLSDLSMLQDNFKTYRSQLDDLMKRYQTAKKVENTDEVKRLEKEVEKLEGDLKGFDVSMSKIKEKMSDVSSQEKEKKSAFFDVQRAMQDASTIVHRIEQELNHQEIEKAKLETKRDSLENEMRYELEERIGEIKQVSVEVVKDVNVSELQPTLFRLKHRLEMIGGIDPETVSEFEEVKDRYDFLVSQVEDLLKTIEALESGIADLQVEMKRRRTEVIGKINTEFGKYFQILFAGGKAGLVPLYASEKLAHEGDPEPQGYQDEVEIKKRKKGDKELIGIEITAQPPGKRIKDINILSGGERAMTSVALICAILTVSPSPFVVLDEVDAALDEANSIRYAEILEKLSHTTQFIVVTHNRASMQKSKVLYGVTMGDDGVSQLLSVELEKAAAWAK